MPLHDHFHEPLYPRHSFESFHTRWANAIADRLDELLPPGFFSEVQTHLGAKVEADVAEFSSQEQGGNGAVPGGNLAVETCTAADVSLSFPAIYPDSFEVQVLDSRDDVRLVGVVELVSPRNKDRAEARRAFASKCAAYLQRGIGLVVIDIVTSRRACMHTELMTVLDLAQQQITPEPSLYAVSYLPVHRQGAHQIDVRAYRLALAAGLPCLPLNLRTWGAVPLDLEATYESAYRRARLPGGDLTPP